MFDEDDLTLDKVESMILNREQAGRRVRMISRDPKRPSVLNRLGRRFNGSVSRGRSREKSRDSGFRGNNRYRSRSRSLSFDRRDRSSPRERALKCQRSGHIRRFCYDLKNKSKKVKFVDAPEEKKPKLTAYQKNLRRRLNRSVSDDEIITEGEMDCMNVSSINRLSQPCFRAVCIEGRSIRMEIDCGAAVIALDRYKVSHRFGSL